MTKKLECSQRKGQHLFNEIAKRNDLQSWKVQITLIGDYKKLKQMPTEFLYSNLHSILFNMTDAEFDEIMTLRGNG